MSSTQFFRELLFPLTNLTLLLWILAATVLAAIATTAGIFGLWLAIIIGFAWCKYLVILLRDRMLGLSPSVPDVEVFNPAVKFWALGGVALFVLLVMTTSVIYRAYGVVPAIIFGTVLFSTYPVAVASIAVSQSGAAAFNLPRHLMIIRRIGWRYGQVFLAMLAGVCLLLVADFLQLPQLLRSFVSAYFIVLLFSFTGALLYHYRVELGIDAYRSPEKADEKLRTQTEAEYRKVATHAYGIISRGNRAGGMKHIRDYLDGHGRSIETLRWFFDELGGWEIDAPHFELSNDYLLSLLAHGDGNLALKVAYRCFERDHRYRPSPEIAELLIEQAQALGWQDMVGRLRALY